MEQKWIDKYPFLYGPGAKDPDEGSGNVELTDVVARLMEKFTGYGGTFSTWAERHAFIYGANIGYLYVNSSEDVPPVPAFWTNEAHYWLTGITMGRAAKKIEDAAPSIKAYLVTFAAGGFSIAGLLKLIGFA